ncbi:glycosyl transferase family group 2-domain-containing protein [Mycena alexandri]|uniref:Glycosyl transferase family group 2-domain-containing protein n=1 Tax=Mycena alexandri TaxID=1745969 RepID=A0AAD6S476_9AGAR|nr:glycosyl transferase family group 2-domain-containing protein [Mycena alexandri]
MGYDFWDALAQYLLIWRAHATNTSASILTTVSVSPTTTVSAAGSAVNLKSATGAVPGSPSPFRFNTEARITAAAALAKNEVKQKDAAKNKDEFTEKCLRGWHWNLSKFSPIGDPQKLTTTNSRRTARPIRLFAPFYGGLGAGLTLFFVTRVLSTLLIEWRYDGDYTRFALMLTAPYLFCVSLFFALQVINCISFLVGPVAQYHENSRYYSAIRPDANPEVDRHLPHVTVQLPVYKESLKDVIQPSVCSLEKAMQTYARQGGTSSIFVHDDALQLLDADERAQRIAFYAEHNIGWVARPPHDNRPGGFKRTGSFKKASNMNYALALSLKLEAHLAELEGMRDGVRAEGSPDGAGNGLEDRALEMAVEQVYEEAGRRWKPWASNGSACRIGDVILIVDSDTIVPEDCFRDAAREFFECPEVAIIQHESDVMQVAHHYFENGMAHFTRRTSKGISIACANGEVAPFMGHNAFLRWSAIQDVALVDPNDGVTKIWSESNVSEDFDMALRLLLQGYIIRWATYSKGGFKEGVSLTVEDELSRWQKYSYGCSQLIFNPLVDWWHLGPITQRLHTFISSDVPVHYKISMSTYMFSYYGIAASAILAVINYLSSVLNISGFSSHSFEIWLMCTVAFPVAASLGHTLLEYRLGHRNIVPAFIENMTWLPFLILFFSGLSIHLATALFAHMFSYDMAWEATSKEVERANFWIEVPRIWKRFKLLYFICFVLIVAMVVLSLPVVMFTWQTPGTSWTVTIPLAVVTGGHMLFPLVLNPWLMIFSR